MNANGYTDESLAHGAQMQERKSEDEKTGQDEDLFHQTTVNSNVQCSEYEMVNI